MGARQMMPIPPAANQTAKTSATVGMWHFDEMAAEIRQLRRQLAEARVGRGALTWISLLLASLAGSALGYLGAVLQVCR